MGFAQQPGVLVQPLTRTDLMISIPGKFGATCDGFSRREFLRLGGTGHLSSPPLTLAIAWQTLHP